jgi:polyphenol oxidase
MLPLLHSSLLASNPQVVHGFTTAVRAGGERLDLGLQAGAGDWGEVAMSLGLPGAAVARMSQVHGAAVLEAKRGGVVGEADAIYTREPGLLLAVRVADCVPILVVGAGGVAAIHAGWRGIAQGVIGAAVAALGRPSTATIGPCICAACYEVGPEVIVGIAASVPRAVFCVEGPGRDHADLRAAARFQLQEAGVDEVDVIDACTRCRADLHSYRRDGPASGRIAGVVGLR